MSRIEEIKERIRRNRLRGSNIDRRSEKDIKRERFQAWFKDREETRELLKQKIKRDRAERKLKAKVKRVKRDCPIWYKKEIISRYKHFKGCCKCNNYNFPPGLDFHHKDQNKEYNISQMVKGDFTLKKIFKEIKKCVVLCSNCHREEHFKWNKDKLSFIFN